MAPSSIPKRKKATINIINIITIPITLQQSPLGGRGGHGWVGSGQWV